MAKAIFTPGQKTVTVKAAKPFVPTPVAPINLSNDIAPAIPTVQPATPIPTTMQGLAAMKAAHDAYIQKQWVAAGSPHFKSFGDAVKWLHSQNPSAPASSADTLWAQATGNTPDAAHTGNAALGSAVAGAANPTVAALTTIAKAVAPQAPTSVGAIVNDLLYLTPAGRPIKGMDAIVEGVKAARSTEEAVSILETMSKTYKGAGPIARAIAGKTAAEARAALAGLEHGDVAASRAAAHPDLYPPKGEPLAPNTVAPDTVKPGDIAAPADTGAPPSAIPQVTPVTHPNGVFGVDTSSRGIPYKALSPREQALRDDITKVVPENEWPAWVRGSVSADADQAGRTQIAGPDTTSSGLYVPQRWEPGTEPSASAVRTSLREPTQFGANATTEAVDAIAKQHPELGGLTNHIQQLLAKDDLFGAHETTVSLLGHSGLSPEGSQAVVNAAQSIERHAIDTNAPQSFWDKLKGEEGILNPNVPRGGFKITPIADKLFDTPEMKAALDPANNGAWTHKLGTDTAPELTVAKSKDIAKSILAAGHKMPPNMDTPAKLAREVRSLHKVITQGSAYRQWYKEAADNIGKISDATGAPPDVVTQVMAVYSANADPTNNALITMRAINDYVDNNGRILHTNGMGEGSGKYQRGKATAILDDWKNSKRSEYGWNGRKTTTYNGNILAETPGAAGDASKATIDGRMAEGMAGMEKTPDNLYSGLETVIQHLADERGWAASEAQAAAWVIFKAENIIRLAESRGRKVPPLHDAIVLASDAYHSAIEKYVGPEATNAEKLVSHLPSDAGVKGVLKRLVKEERGSFQLGGHEGDLHPAAQAGHDLLHGGEGGFSIEPNGAKAATEQYVHSHPDHELIIPNPTVHDISRYMHEKHEHASAPGHFFGGWRDPETGHAYLDVSTSHADKTEALLRAHDNKQKAIFDMHAFKDIPVPEGLQTEHDRLLAKHNEGLDRIADAHLGPPPRNAEANRARTRNSISKINSGSKSGAGRSNYRRMPKTVKEERRSYAQQSIDQHISQFPDHPVSQAWVAREGKIADLHERLQPNIDSVFGKLKDETGSLDLGAFKRGGTKALDAADTLGKQINRPIDHVTDKLEKRYPTPTDLPQPQNAVSWLGDKIKSIDWKSEQGSLSLRSFMRKTLRTPEQSRAHIESESQKALKEGYGEHTPAASTPTLTKGETTEATGGDLGAQVRHALQGGPTPGVQGSARGAKSARKEQDALYTAERQKRAQAAEKHLQAGDYEAALHELKGALPKVDFQGFKQFDPATVKAMEAHIMEHPHLLPFQKVNTIDAIRAALHGKVPTRSQQVLLEKAFGKTVSDQVVESASEIHKWGKVLVNLLNVPRSIMASMDLSAPFRQGLMVAVSHPVIFGKAFAPMVKAARREENFQHLIQDEIHARPTYPLMEKAKVGFTDIGGDAHGPTAMSNREEQFMSNYAERIPGLGHMVRGSDRAYVGFLNKIRADVFDHLLNSAAAQGLNVGDEHFLESLGKFVNSSTGRGNLGKLNEHTATLNALFFAPRLLASRINFLNPLYYAKLDPFVRRQALKAFLGLGATAATILRLAKMGGANVNLDPTNADFAKIKDGNVRVDVLGGFQQPIRLAAQLAEGKLTSSTTGQAFPLGSGFGKTSRYDVGMKFLQGKLSPIPSLVVDALKGKDFTGNVVAWDQLSSVEREAASRMLPFLAQDLYSIQTTSGTKAAVGLGALDLFGVGVQDYKGGIKAATLSSAENRLDKDSETAGMGKPPPEVVTDLKWYVQAQSAVNQTTGSDGRIDYAKAAAAVAKVYDARYGGTAATTQAQGFVTQGQAQKFYEALSARIAPAYLKWKSVESHRLGIIESQQGVGISP